MTELEKCSDRVVRVLAQKAKTVSIKNKGEKYFDITELAKIVCAIDIIDKYCGEKQSKCECKKPSFSKTFEVDFNMICDRCGKIL